MTYLEKLKAEHPMWALLLVENFSECPEDYGYSMAKELCLCEGCEKIDPKDKDICRRCWNQEIGGTK